MNVKKIIAGILSCTTAFSMSVFYNNTQSTISAESYYIVGDANEDDKLNVRDAAFIASALAKGNVDTLPISADYNQDNSINVRDAAGIARYCAESYSSDIPVITIPVTTTTVSNSNDETTTTTTVGNDDTTTTQTAETVNTLPVETTVAIPSTTTTSTTTTTIETTAQTTTTTILTTATETVSSTTTAHVHSYVTETEIVEHEAEYQTKTIWCYMPGYYAGNQWMEEANVRAFDRYIPEDGNIGWYDRITDYDLVTWYYGDGTWDSIAKYKDLAPWNDVNSEFYIDTEYFRNSEFFTSYIDKNNFIEYGLTEEQWYDVNYMQKKMLPAGTDILGRDMTGNIGVFDYWGNFNPTFNPECDVLINLDTTATHQPCEADDGLDSKESNFECIVNKYMPVAQEKFLVNDAWTEIVTHEVCECGHTK